ncbi:hypothetical protein IFT71_11800 [Sphingomonas sp. CFBP 13733]|jgi:hypothetical protein|nr:hypothetical protein [Sphingomonas sp. CFBP 13733]
MKPHEISRTGWAPTGWHITMFAAFAIATPWLSVAADAQTRTARDTATAYGARLNARGEPANLNPNRINNRVNSRLDTRLSLRVERYRPDSTSDPAAAFAVQATDNARIGTDTTLSPLSTSTSSSMLQTFGASSQSSIGPHANATRPR